MKNTETNTDLLNEIFKVISYLPENLKLFSLSDKDCTIIQYPINIITKKITSINLDKDPYLS